MNSFRKYEKIRGNCSRSAVLYASLILVCGLLLNWKSSVAQDTRHGRQSIKSEISGEVRNTDSVKKIINFRDDTFSKRIKIAKFSFSYPLEVQFAFYTLPQNGRQKARFIFVGGDVPIGERSGFIHPNFKDLLYKLDFGVAIPLSWGVLKDQKVVPYGLFWKSSEETTFYPAPRTLSAILCMRKDNSITIVELKHEKISNFVVARKSIEEAYQCVAAAQVGPRVIEKSERSICNNWRPRNLRRGICARNIASTEARNVNILVKWKYKENVNFSAIYFETKVYLYEVQEVLLNSTHFWRNVGGIDVVPEILWAVQTTAGEISGILIRSNDGSKNNIELGKIENDRTAFSSVLFLGSGK